MNVPKAMLENSTTRVLMRSTANPDCSDIYTRMEGVKKLPSYDVITDKLLFWTEKYNILI